MAFPSLPPLHDVLFVAIFTIENNEQSTRLNVTLLIFDKGPILFPRLSTLNVSHVDV